MSHVIEPAASGRAKCRGCKNTIAKGELRFGERLPNPFADGEMTIWFHLQCAAWRRPESLGEILDDFRDQLDDADVLAAAVDAGIRHRRLERIAGIERAPSGRARCRACREAIAKDEWRISLEFFEEGMFNPSGFIHTKCASDYFETTDIMDRIIHFAGNLEAKDIEDIRKHIA